MRATEFLIESAYLYHVTFAKNAPKIKLGGLLQFQPSNWSKGEGGERYNEDAGIFAFDHPIDALNWAGKMEYEFGEDIAIVRIDLEEFWETDPTQDPSLAYGQGKPVRSDRNISAEKIVDIVDYNDLGKPGTLNISRDDWLEQSAAVLSS